jgi:integrase
LAEAQTENRARVDAKELLELLVKIYNCNGDAIARLAMKLMAYTFIRTSEEIEAPWSGFDLDEARWTIPAERMKRKTPHIVPLSRQAVEVLRAFKQITGNGKFVFAGSRDEKKPIGNNTILYSLYRLGYRDRMTGHGVRELASTIPSNQQLFMGRDAGTTRSLSLGCVYLCHWRNSRVSCGIEWCDTQ